MLMTSLCRFRTENEWLVFPSNQIGTTATIP